MKNLKVVSECPFCSECVFLYECNIIYLFIRYLVFVFIACPPVIENSVISFIK